MTALARPAALVRRPAMVEAKFATLVTAAAVFLLYANAGGVAIAEHGAPAVVGLALLGLLALPVLTNLLRDRTSLAVPATAWWLLLFLAVQIVSTAFSAFQPQAAGQLVQFLVEGIVLFFLITNAIRSEDDLRAAVWAVVLAAGALGFLSVVQWTTGSFLRPYAGFALIPSDYLSGLAQEPRSAGPLGDPNYYAQILLPAVPLAIYLLRRGGHGQRALAAAALVCCVSGILLSSSRGAGLGILAVLVVATLLRVVKPQGLVLTIVAMAVVLAAVPAYRDRVTSVSSLTSATAGPGVSDASDQSFRSRATEMLAAVYVFVDHPVVGAGPGVFPLYYQRYAQRIGRDVHEEVRSGANRGGVPQREAHNMFLGVAAETGLVGLLAFGGGLAATVRGLARARRRTVLPQLAMAPLAAALLLAIVGYVSSGLFLSLAFERYFWMLLALGAAAAQLARERASDGTVSGGSVPPRDRWPRSARYAAAAGSGDERTAAAPLPATLPSQRAPLVESSNLLPLIVRWWRVVLCAGVLCGLAGALGVSQLPPTYESSVQLLTGPTNTSFDTLRASGELARTYAELAVTRPLLQSVADEVGIEGGADALADRVGVNASTVSRLVTISVKDEDPERAARAATAIAERLLALRQNEGQQLSTRIDELLRRHELADLPVATRESVRDAAVAVIGPPEAGRLTVVNPAAGRTEKTGPKAELLVALAVLAGLLASSALAALSSVFRPRVDRREQLSELAGIPCLGSVEALRRCPSGSALGGRRGDAYRLLATKLGVFQASDKLKGIVVIGADESAEAGAVATGLAAVAAAARVRVTLIDADYEARQVTRIFSAETYPGYTDLAAVDGNLDEHRIAVDEDLDLIPCGRGDELPGRAAIGSLLDHLQAAGTELVVVAVPPISRSSASALWADAIDACLLVARHGATNPTAVSNAAEALSHTGALLAGTALVEGRIQLRSSLVADPLRDHASSEPAHDDPDKGHEPG